MADKYNQVSTAIQPINSSISDSVQLFNPLTHGQEVGFMQAESPKYDWGSAAGWHH